MGEDGIDNLLANALIGQLAMVGSDGRPYAIQCLSAGSATCCMYAFQEMPGKGRVHAENDCVCFEVVWTAPDLSNDTSIRARIGRAPSTNLERKSASCSPVNSGTSGCTGPRVKAMAENHH